MLDVKRPIGGAGRMYVMLARRDRVGSAPKVTISTDDERVVDAVVKALLAIMRDDEAASGEAGRRRC